MEFAEKEITQNYCINGISSYGALILCKHQRCKLFFMEFLFISSLIFWWSSNVCVCGTLCVCAVLFLIHHICIRFFSRSTCYFSRVKFGTKNAKKTEWKIEMTKQTLLKKCFKQLIKIKTNRLHLTHANKFWWKELNHNGTLNEIQAWANHKLVQSNSNMNGFHCVSTGELLV